MINYNLIVTHTKVASSKEITVISIHTKQESPSIFCPKRSNKVVVNAVVAEPFSHDGLGALVSESVGSERTLAHLHSAGDSRAAGSTPCSGAVLFVQGPPGNNKTKTHVFLLHCKKQDQQLI